MPNKSAAQVCLEKIAEDAVVNTRKAFPLGSGNVQRTAFYPPWGMLQYMPKQQKRFQNKVRQTEALTLVRNEDVRDLPGVYKHEQEMRSFDALVGESRADIADFRVRKAQSGYDAVGMQAALVAALTGANEQCLAMSSRLRLAIHAKAGNCSEMVNFTFSYIFSNYYHMGLEHIKPEILSCYRTGVIGKTIFGSSVDIYDSKIDHFCVAIGRTCDDPDWRKWNPEAIIIDPWINKWFYVRDLYKFNPWPFHVHTMNIRFECLSKEILEYLCQQNIPMASV